MADPTERNVNVSVVDKSRGFKQLALNPTTGQPLFIVFVNNTAPAGGDGTFLHPLNTLAVAPASPASTASSPSSRATARPATRTPASRCSAASTCLGTGVPNFIVSQQGVFTLPAIGSGTPVITNTAGVGTVILNNNNEVANLIDRQPVRQRHRRHRHLRLQHSWRRHHRRRRQHWLGHPHHQRQRPRPDHQHLRHRHGRTTA